MIIVFCIDISPRGRMTRGRKGTRVTGFIDHCNFAFCVEYSRSRSPSRDRRRNGEKRVEQLGSVIIVTLFSVKILLCPEPGHPLERKGDVEVEGDEVEWVEVEGDTGGHMLAIIVDTSLKIITIIQTLHSN